MFLLGARDCLYPVSDLIHWYESQIIEHPTEMRELPITVELDLRELLIPVLEQSYA